ncbi:MAG: hypothetical protein RL011_2175 [Pseudomonadota bacterium]|jgi:arylsulfatase
MKRILVLTSVALASIPTVTSGAFAVPSKTQNRPNILVFLLDDVGFGHLSAFGGPVNTPNMDRIAEMGLRFNNFHTTSLCSPSRAALLTGRNHHSVATGVVTELASNAPGYTMHIPKNKFPVVETLRENGYKTAAFGKWHNTPVDQLQGSATQHDQWPTDIGFQRFYGFMSGDSSQWEPVVWDNTTVVQPNLGKPQYHFTTDIANQAIKWLRERDVNADEKPFFIYFATGAGHAPHHAPEEYAAKYRGKFDQGWDQMRKDTLHRQKALGLVPESTQLTPRPDIIPAWDNLSADQKRLYSRMQELFAGYVEHADAEFGRVLDEIARLGQLDNTIILITSDNGASGEGGLDGSVNENLLFNGIPDNLEHNLAQFDALGTYKTYNHYPAGWALAGNTPFRYWKQTTHAGGVRDPFILAWKNRIKDGGSVRQQFTHMVDVAPTLLELTGIKAPEKVRGVAQAPMEGASFAGALTNPLQPPQRNVQYFEMLGNRAIWMDGWKAIAFHGRYPWERSGSNPDFSRDQWELYNLGDDFSESQNLATKYPERLAELRSIFDQQAKVYNVYPLDDSTLARVTGLSRQILGDRSNFLYRQSDVGISEPASPPVKNRSHTIIADFNVPESGGDGVIVSSGGRFGGYSLYVKDGHLHYVQNYLGMNEYDIVAPEQLPRGKVQVKFEFVRTGNNTGKGILYLNNRQVAEGIITHTAPMRYSIAETFDVGSDYGSPVTSKYSSPNRYPSCIDSVSIAITDGPVPPEADTTFTEPGIVD